MVKVGKKSSIQMVPSCSPGHFIRKPSSESKWHSRGLRGTSFHRLAAEDNGLCTIRGYLAHGNPRMAREWLQYWSAANMVCSPHT